MSAKDYLSGTAPVEACYAHQTASGARTPGRGTCRPGYCSCAAKVPGFEMSAEKFDMIIKLKILSSDHSFKDPAQVLRTYPGPR
jgi:hypothetical protein